MFRGREDGRKVIAIIDDTRMAGFLDGHSLEQDPQPYRVVTRGDSGINGTNELSEKQFYRPGQTDPGIYKVPATAIAVIKDTELLQARLDAMQARIAKALGHSPRVRFAAYEQDAQDLPLDNLDQIAHLGRMVFCWNDFTDRSVHRGEPIENPTWLRLSCEADAQLQRSGDVDHVYLEGIDVLDWEDGTAVAELVMGS